MTRRAVPEIQADLDAERALFRVLRGAVQALKAELAEAQARDAAEPVRTGVHHTIPVQRAA